MTLRALMAQLGDDRSGRSDDFVSRTKALHARLFLHGALLAAGSILVFALVELAVGFSRSLRGLHLASAVVAVLAAGGLSRTRWGAQHLGGLVVAAVAVISWRNVDYSGYVTHRAQAVLLMQQIVTAIVALLACPSLASAVISITIIGAVPLVAQLAGAHTIISETASGWAASVLGLGILATLSMRWRHRVHRMTVALEHRAHRDPLTGVTNRRGFLEAARARIARGPASLIYLDADHFKGVNDTCGHAVGDQVLVALGVVLRAQLRPGDVVGRLGGEEFAVLLVGARPAEAVQIAQRLRRAVNAAPAIPITISVGIASTPGSLETLISRADAAMLDAKRRGRDRLVVAQQTLTPVPRSPA